MDIKELEAALKAEKATNKELKSNFDKVVIEKENLTAELTNKNEVIKALEADKIELENNSSADKLESAEKRIIELEALAEKNPAAKLVVNGTFEKGTGKGKKHYTFKDGFVKTRNLNGDVVTSEEALKDTDLMNHLIKIKYSGIEEVK